MRKKKKNIVLVYDRVKEENGMFSKNDYPIFAKQLFTVLKDYSPEEYWRDAANTRLQELNIN